MLPLDGLGSHNISLTLLAGRGEAASSPVGLKSAFCIPRFVQAKNPKKPLRNHLFVVK
jgi:hypothetical protein